MSDLIVLLARFSGAAVAGDGQGVAACFAEDGRYNDVFYGSFDGRDAIADMIENRFHRDGADFRWDFHDPVGTEETGYARYLFSYRSKKANADAARAVFEGVAILTMRDGLIGEYAEVANPYTGLARMGLSDAHLAKFARTEAEKLAARPEAHRHLE